MFYKRRTYGSPSLALGKQCFEVSGEACVVEVQVTMSIVP